MTMLTRLVAALVVLGAALTVPAQSQAAPRFVPLSGADKHIAFHASHLAAGHPGAAIRWAAHQRSVQRVILGLDHQTVEIRFQDGATVALLPKIARPILPAALVRVHPHARSADGSAPRAAVLEPFADDLGLGTAAGQNVASLLTSDGFRVDVLRNDQVTVSVMQNVSQYSVVYMLTHSGELDNGHALLLLGETDQHPYTALMKECDSEMPPLCSVMQGIGEGETKISVAITDLFVQRHMSAFPNSSLVFLNGCDIMPASAFVASWHQKNVASLLGWDGKVASGITELSAQALFQDLTAGSTVNASLQDLAARGFATSLVNNKVAYLKQDGDGDLTLAEAKSETAPPQPTSTATATSTPDPTHTPMPTPTRKPTKKPSCPAHSSKKHGKCTCLKGYTKKHGKCVRKKTH